MTLREQNKNSVTMSRTTRIHRPSGQAEAKITSSNALADRLKATEDALRAAQVTIARQEICEQNLRRLVVSNGIAQVTTEVNPAVEAKISALKAVQEQKVRALMRSIKQLQDQLQGLKAEEKEHRRSALIQELRKDQREQELVIDVLKQTLQEKIPEFQDSRALVNDFVIKKSVGGPIRFRPRTREEIESDLFAVRQNFQRTVEKLKKDNLRVAAPKDKKHHGSDGDKEGEGENEKESNNNSVAVDEKQLEEIERLRAQLASKLITIHAQSEEMTEAYAELERLRVVEDQIVRKKHKIALLRKQLEHQQSGNIELVQEKEVLAEKCLRLQEETQFLQNLHVEDAGAKDEERLHQLELIQTLRSREVELQDELECQQRLWARDRDTIHQQLRTLEKEKTLAVDEAARWKRELADRQTKCESLHKEVLALTLTVEGAQKQKAVLSNKIEELDAKTVHLETLRQEERASSTREVTEKIKGLEKLVEEKSMAVKKADRQLNALKLLSRQSKKENESLSLRLSKLEAELAGQTTSLSDKVKKGLH